MKKRYNVSEKFKTECKSNVGNLKYGNIHIVEDNIDITESTDLQDFEIEDNCYVNDKFIGTTVTKKAVINLTTDEPNMLENKEVELSTEIHHFDKEKIVEGEQIHIRDAGIPIKLELSGNTVEIRRRGEKCRQCIWNQSCWTK